MMRSMCASSLPTVVTGVSLCSNHHATCCSIAFPFLYFCYQLQGVSGPSWRNELHGYSLVSNVGISSSVVTVNGC